MQKLTLYSVIIHWSYSRSGNTCEGCSYLTVRHKEGTRKERTLTKGHGNGAEGGAEEQDGIAHPEEVGVLHQSSVEKGKEQGEQETVEAVVDILRSRRLRIGEAQVGQDARQDHEQRHYTRHGGVLQFEDVPLI